MVWSDERVVLLKRLWTEGLSASQIAGRIGNGVTRNGVIGKAHRLNLSGRTRQPKQTVQRKPYTRKPSTPPTYAPTNGEAGLKPIVREVRARSLPVVEPKPLVLANLPKGGRVTILHISDKTCKWPIGDPEKEDFCFCGHKPRWNSPYCEYHVRLAYQPLQDRRHRRKSAA